MIRATLLRLSASSVIGAEQIKAKLQQHATLQPCTMINVKDASGGCGSFFQVEVVSEAFTGKKLVEQHRMVNEALREEIKQIHGLTITTRTK